MIQNSSFVVTPPKKKPKKTPQKTSKETIVREKFPHQKQK